MHHGVKLSFDGDRQRIDFSALVGKQVMVYGQTEVTRDLMDLRQGRTIYEAEDVELHDFDGAPWVSYRKDGITHRIELRLYRGVRRLSWREPRKRAGSGAERVRTRLFVRLAGRAGRQAAGGRRADLCAS